MNERMIKLLERLDGIKGPLGNVHISEITKVFEEEFGEKPKKVLHTLKISVSGTCKDRIVDDFIKPIIALHDLEYKYDYNGCVTVKSYKLDALRKVSEELEGQVFKVSNFSGTSYSHSGVSCNIIMGD